MPPDANAGSNGGGERRPVAERASVYGGRDGIFIGAHLMAKARNHAGPPPSGRKRPPAPPEGRAPHRPPPAAQRRHDPDVTLLYGFHSVEAALAAAARKLIRLYATKEAAQRLAPLIEARKLETTLLSAAEIDRLAPRDAVHQGLLLEARPLKPMALEDLPAKGIVLVLDQINDPHNVGAILRTAAAFGVEAIVTTERHRPEFSGVLAKAASGGLEVVPICLETNLARALGHLADLGYWRVGLDSEAPIALERAKLTKPLALVLGAEGKGLRRLSREHCDELARLELPGPIKSLNVSNAAAIALQIAYGANAKA